MGSSSIPCLSRLDFSPGDDNGEWDVTVRELVRILYLSGSARGQREGGILAPSTIDYMYDHLLAASGPLSDASYSAIFDCGEPAGDELGSPEDRADRDAWYRDLLDDLGDFLEWAAITYLTYGLVPGGGALIVAPFLLNGLGGDPTDIFLSHWDVRIPETENHRLNIESSKFLINADIIARLKAENGDLGDFVKDQAEVRNWLMERLQDITKNDFTEYNARPYSRYSLNSILNLYDFAKTVDEPELALAARIVLDLSGAKFAATSNRGRRIVGFRRRSDEDGSPDRYLFESISGADHEITRAMLLSGQTQNLDKTLNDDIRNRTLAEMVNAATSEYRLPASAVSAAIGGGTFEQTIRHAGVERVEQSPAFTISAGGIPTEPTAYVLIPALNSDTDRGVAMPTVIIPTIAGSKVLGSPAIKMRDLFRFDGVGLHDKRTANTCVAPGFACGLSPSLSSVFSDSREGPAEDMLFFISSAESHFESGPHFYLAARIVHCVTGKACAWGIMDIIEAPPMPTPTPTPTGTPIPAGTPTPTPTPDPAYLLFQAQRRAALRAVTLDGRSRGVYKTAAGHEIVFGLNEPTHLTRFGGEATVISIDGQPPPEWKTSGGLIDADGQGHITIKGAEQVVIDFSDPMHPSRIVSTPTPSP